MVLNGLSNFFQYVAHRGELQMSFPAAKTDLTATASLFCYPAPLLFKEHSRNLQVTLISSRKSSLFLSHCTQSLNPGVANYLTLANSSGSIIFF